MRFFSPYFQDLWNTRTIDKEVVTLTKPARVFGFTMHVGIFLNTTNTYSHGWLVDFFLILLLVLVLVLLLPFLLLLSLLVTSIKAFTRRRGRNGGRKIRRRR